MSGADKTKVFVDSNVVLYLLSSDTVKADRAEALLRRRPTISVQVLNEVTNVCVRKLGMAWREVDQFLELVRQFCVVAPLTIEMHDLARRIAERYGLAFYDACIVAAASIEGCHVLYTEDMHHGLIIEDSLTLRNPFA
ncbi:PilT domain-containing protein [Burkholderia pseudomallei]|uniref:PIN domain-containing protein n=1 Tax=Burkholderia pseudomallei TaxID=28450 RepID=UPI000F0677DA|nr:PIN domain-containing protein [Burkholderia pseudomallei]CAJ9343539.1 PilT domain-containing protein [Burkholderia pseudomallei]VBN64272.1 PilT domain-containing protein [Burkholderia pseudomallei]